MPERGLQLKTLADHRIRCAILDYLRGLDPVPRSLRRFVRQRAEMSVSLQRRLDRLPEEAELAQALGLSIQRNRRLLVRTRASQILSLEVIGERALVIPS